MFFQDTHPAGLRGVGLDQAAHHLLGPSRYEPETPRYLFHHPTRLTGSFMDDSMPAGMAEAPVAPVAGSKGVHQLELGPHHRH